MVDQKNEQLLLQQFFFVIDLIIFLRLIFLVLKSTSAKTGFDPQFKTALAVETHVKLGIMISPLTPNDLIAHSSALVHEFIAIEYLVLNFLLNSSSNL